MCVRLKYLNQEEHTVLAVVDKVKFNILMVKYLPSLRFNILATLNISPLLRMHKENF